ncbi:MAG: 3-oxoacyl-ACP reductase FabG [Cellvibrionaceae bacterium]|nr:3-oxoacyl-ACP reductase FabG [Cellvibrionaceae bacterium]
MPRRVLVTGANRGIGKAIALALAEQGFCVTVHYRSQPAEADTVVKQIIDQGGQADRIQFDVSQRQATRETLERHLEKNGAFYGVVCNAGITRDNAFPSLVDDDWDSVISTNLGGLFNVLKPLIMPMIKLRAGGRIVNLSSVSGLVGNRGQANYSASKAGIIGASKSLAIELAKRKITVNCVAPGVIETDMIEGVFAEEAIKMIPLRRFGLPEEVAATVSFLFSDKAGYITRQVISVNGGMC